MKVMYLCDFASFYDFGIRFWIRSESVVYFFFLNLFVIRNISEDINSAVHWFNIKRVSGSLEIFLLRFGHVRLILCPSIWSPAKYIDNWCHV